MAATASALAAPALGATSSRPLTRIAFGACANQDKPQPIWDVILDQRPDIYLALGDNIYADTRDMGLMKAKYDRLAAIPQFKRFRSSVPIMAIWDDHDFGEDDAGRDYPMKAQSRELFCDFWDVPANSPRRTRDGIYTAEILGPAGHSVQVVMPDLRWNRTSLRSLDLGGTDYKTWAKGLETRGQPVPGPYERNPDLAATMLGEPQWAWLEAELRRPAEIRILASSLQVLADFAGWEGWINFARDQARLFQLIHNTRAEGLICISGDTHYGEISRLDVNTPYPIWDITSSGITEVWPVAPPNALRLGEILREQNFGLLEIDWSPAKPLVTAKVMDAKGIARLSRTIDTSELRLT
jgi:alkaline phosphatase D